MQGQDKSPKSSRPSLLTPAQQAEAERNRILSTLESSGTAQKGTTGRPAWRWGALAAAVLALGAGAFYATQQDGDAPTVARAVPVAPLAPLAPAPAAVAGVPAAAAPATATIEDQAPAADPAKPRQSLSDMLGDTPAAAPAPTKNVLSQALEAPAAKPAGKPANKESGKGATKPASTKKSDAKATRTDQKTEKHPFAKDVAGKDVAGKEVAGKGGAAPDGDVALLSALIAHDHAGDAPAAMVKPRLSLDQQLAACAGMKGAKAARCHRRVCEGRSKTGGCKVSK